MPPSSSTDRSSARNRLFDPTPNDLRELVLDYLCHNSYADAARSFVKDSAVKHLDADGDEIMQPTERGDPLADTLEERLAAGELRKEIRICILSGQVDEAIALLHKHFPQVLSEIFGSEEGSACRPTDRQGYVPATSVDPIHLALNLRILAFIEAARTIPLPYYHPGTKAPPPPSTSDASKDVDMLRHEGSSDDANDQLLHRAQNLYSEANRLPDPNDRARYLHELAQVGGLLAYTVPERGPMAIYMTQERREAVADMIESAIMYRTGQRIVSGIELRARYTSVLWSVLHDMNIKPPPRSAWPAGISLPPSGKATSKSVTGGETVPHVAVKKSSRDADLAEPVPVFDLQAFLDTSP